MPLDQYFSRALRNICQHGDTDIFPYPVDNLVFFDKKQSIIDLLKQIAGNYEDNLKRYPPANSNTLAPVGYTGFRWATQIDPIWNAFYLGIVLSIAEKIEETRIPIADKTVFSYRYKYNENTHALFDPDYGYKQHMERSLELSESHGWIVVCDISEFYPRLNHHKLENSLLQLRLPGSHTAMIREFLKDFSNTYSFGLPVGGPASRILSELLLDQVDRLLKDNGITFSRFADDIHIFANSYEEAFKSLVFLTDVLYRNQGLQLQKSKTRVMTSGEFQSTSPYAKEFKDAASNSLAAQARELIRFSMRFDPYAAHADTDYARLKGQIKQFDILGILKSELSKSQIHISLSRKIVTAIKYMDAPQQGEALVSLIQNHDTLYPIFSNVLLTIKSLFDEIDQRYQQEIMQTLIKLIRSDSHVFSVDLNLAYAVRLLSCRSSDSNSEILTRIYRGSRNSIIRRDIIIAMTRWRKHSWLFDVRTSFRTLDSIERRAFIIASYYLTDEGKHWREFTEKEFSPFEQIISQWAAEKSKDPKWEVPL